MPYKEKLSIFELALRDAGIAHYNPVRVSSIFPPNCKIVSREDGLQLLQPGEIVDTNSLAMAVNAASG